MQNPFETDRDVLLLLVIALAAGVIVGLLLAPKGSRSSKRMIHSGNTHDNRRITDRKRSAINVVFGNIVVGSNNGRENLMTFGYEDSGDNG